MGEAIADIPGVSPGGESPLREPFGVAIQAEPPERRGQMEKPLRIGLDVLPLAYPPSGVRAYVEALIDELRSRDAGIEIVPLSPPGGRSRSAGRLARLRWDLRAVGQDAQAARIDLLHMTRFAAPRSAPGPLVVTVHDLIPLLLPEYRASRPALIQAELARRTVPAATRVIVPSHYVAGDVERLLGIDPGRIDVIPMGVTIVDAAGESAPFSGPYVLHTGGFDARKNLPVLLRAFADASRSLDPDWRLVLVGAPHSRNARVYPDVRPLIRTLKLEDRVILTGRVDEAEKHALYHFATIAVAPSLSEGFGLPILEAMAHGVPVIASNRTSHPEVAGDAALLVEPTAAGLAEELVHLGNDPAARADYANRGRERAALFPWSRTAALTVETYRKAIDDAQTSEARHWTN